MLCRATYLNRRATPPCAEPNGRGVGAQLEHASEERLERFRAKMLALDVESLSQPGYVDPLRAVGQMRLRAEALAAAAGRPT